MNPVIELSHVSFQYEANRPILRDISFRAQPGESIGLVGANGVGKSTLLKLLVGLNEPTAGSIQVGGLPLARKNLPAIRQKVGYVFQDSESQLFLSTVHEDIAFAPRNYGFPAEEVDRRVTAALEAVGIPHLRERQIYKLSGGEKKLVSLATILSMTPDIILLDEPSVALDPRNRRRLIGLLRSFSQLRLIASHDLDLVLDTCTRTILLAEGTIVRDGATRDILSDRALLEENGLELPLCLQGRAAP